MDTYAQFFNACDDKLVSKLDEIDRAHDWAVGL